MAIVSAVVEFDRSVAPEAFSGGLRGLRNVELYGVKDRKAVVVIEGDDLGSVRDTVAEIRELGGVLGVFPVYSGDM